MVASGRSSAIRASYCRTARKELEHVYGAAKGKIDLGAARRFTSSTSFGLTTATDKPASHRNNEYFDQIMR